MSITRHVAETACNPHVHRVWLPSRECVFGVYLVLAFHARLRCGPLSASEETRVSTTNPQPPILTSSPPHSLTAHPFTPPLPHSSRITSRPEIVGSASPRGTNSNSNLSVTAILSKVSVRARRSTTGVAANVNLLSHHLALQFDIKLRGLGTRLFKSSEVATHGVYRRLVPFAEQRDFAAGQPRMPDVSTHGASAFSTTTASSFS